MKESFEDFSKQNNNTSSEKDAPSENIDTKKVDIEIEKNKEVEIKEIKSEYPKDLLEKIGKEPLNLLESWKEKAEICQKQIAEIENSDILDRDDKLQKLKEQLSEYEEIINKYGKF